MSDVTRILSKIETGDAPASEELLPLVYDELRKLAAARMSGERLDHTLQSTALVHEAYVRLVDVDSVKEWDSRGHFFAAAAEAMRRILIDYARSKASKKRDARFEAVEVTSLQEKPQTLSAEQFLDLDDTLKKLEREDPPSRGIGSIAGVCRAERHRSGQGDQSLSYGRLRILGFCPGLVRCRNAGVNDLLCRRIGPLRRGDEQTAGPLALD